MQFICCLFLKQKQKQNKYNYKNTFALIYKGMDKSLCLLSIYKKLQKVYNYLYNLMQIKRNQIEINNLENKKIKNKYYNLICSNKRNKNI
jgi:hypothetical protein